MGGKFFRAVFFFALLPLALASCRTGPAVAASDPVLGEAAGGYFPLEAGASVYLFADMEAARPLLELFPFADMGDRRTQQVVGMTQTAAVALFPEDNDKQFQLVLSGNYSSGRAAFALGASRHWRRQRFEHGAFWRSRDNEFSLALGPRQVFMAAWRGGAAGPPFTQGAGIRMPDGFYDFQRGAVISLWMEDPEPRINHMFEEFGLPLQIPAESVFVSLFQAAGGEYEAVIRARIHTELQANALVTLFSMARFFMELSAPTAGADHGSLDIMGMMGAVLFANPLVVNGRDIDIKTAAFSESEIAALLEMFSLILD